MDFGGSAVWGDAPSLSNLTQPSAIPPPASLFAPPKEDPFDDFDDFDTAKEADPTRALDDDDFGDFGDFAEQPVASNEGGQDDTEFGFPSDDVQSTALRTSWSPLRLDPMPNSIELTEQVGDLLSSIVRGPNIDAMLTGEGIKQIEAPTQLLVTPDRCVYGFPPCSILIFR
jgi:Domain of unknown function (DUF5102)